MSILLTGVGSGAVPFVPSDVANLQLWLAADRGLSLNDNDLVGLWSDQSGNNNNTTQSASSKRPTYKNNIINGKPAIRFDGTDDVLVSAAGAAANLTGDFTMFAILQGSDTVAAAIPFMWGDFSVGERRAIWINITNGYGQFSGHTNNVVTTYVVKDGAAHYIVITFDGTTIKIRIDGTERATGTPTLNAFTDERFGVGANSIETEFFKDDLLEIGAYASEISGDDLINLETYLANRAGL